jgi:nucleotide-binding universal stress UspA family protein
MFDRILLGADGSEHAQRAAKVAGDLARALKSTEVRIVVAFDPIPAYLGEPNLSQAEAARAKAADEILAKARSALGAIPGEVHEETLAGAPAEAIVQVAKTRNSELIVMGSRGLGRLEGALLGSNSQKVVSHATCPVMIVR